MNVTNFGWSVSNTTGSGIDGAILNVYKNRGLKVVKGYQACWLQNGELNGKHFKSSEAASEAAAAHGYTKTYFSRPTSFINLRLSPATRRFLKPLSNDERMLHLLRLCKETTCNMVAEVATKECLSSRLAEWMEYLDGKNPEAKHYARHA